MLSYIYSLLFFIIYFFIGIRFGVTLDEHNKFNFKRGIPKIIFFYIWPIYLSYYLLKIFFTWVAKNI